MTRKQKYSMIIPIGKFSFFVHATLKNIFETIESDIDIVLLTSQNNEQHINNAILKEKKNHQFRVLSAPFESGSNHLRLLDWAMHHDSIKEWVIIQHSDLFWKRKGWLKKIDLAAKHNATVICTPNYHFNFKGRKMPLVGDYFGAYKKNYFVDNNFTFQWENYSKNSKRISPKTKHFISNGDIKYLTGKTINENDFLDGSVIFSMEMFERSNRVRILDFPEMVHLVAFFRIADSIHWDKTNQTLNINLPFLTWYGGCNEKVWIDAFARYSFLTSLVFNKEEVLNPLPWSLIEKISRIENIDLSGGSSVGEWLRSYHCHQNTIGMDSFGIKKLSFSNKEYNF